MNEIMEFINSCGYPIVVSILLITNNNKQISALTESVKTLCNKVDILIDRDARD